MSNLTAPQWLFDDAVPMTVREQAFEAYLLEQDKGMVKFSDTSLTLACGVCGIFGLVSILALAGLESSSSVISLGLMQALFAFGIWFEQNKKQTALINRVNTIEQNLKIRGWDYFLGKLEKIEAPVTKAH